MYVELQNEWIDSRALATELKVTEGHVRYMAREKLIPSVKVGRRRRRFQLAKVIEALNDVSDGEGVL